MSLWSRPPLVKGAWSRMGARVSTVIPCYNAATFIERALASALSQEGVDVDVIVVDDGSSDDSVARIRALGRLEPRIQLLSFSSNRGAAAARNAGIERASARYLAFLDADDWWRPNKLARQVEMLKAQRAALAYTGVEVHDERGRALGRRRVPTRVGAEQLLVHNVIATSSVLIDTERVLPFRMPPLRMRQDLATWYALLQQGVRAFGLDEPLTVYTRRADSLSANKAHAAAANWRLYRQHLGTPLPQAVAMFTKYAATALVRP
ncbi:MAG TPA: glycosyltransferase family A protein [Verrucomicrobiae bacterium]|nr:glycosyltransferase family A protein [Verrucomicrobiae bacterium]